MDLIAFYADNALIKKATSAEETPTPGYLYHEIVGITHKSVEACQNLENMLLSRLENDSPIVKLKTLRTIKHILQKGHVSVKRDLMSRVTSIRPCVQARGPSDPLRGDSMWQSVRTEAQEVITLIFDTDQRVTSGTPVAVTSMGSDQFGTRNYQPSSNNNQNGNHQTNSNYEAANANYISSSTSASYTNYPSSGSSSAGSGFASTSTNLANLSAQDIKNKISSLPSKFMSNNTNKPNHDLSNFGSLNAAVSHASTSHSHSSTTGGSDWGYAPPSVPSHASNDEESALVEDITNSSVSSTLSFQALDQFCARGALLDQSRIAELLFRKLESRTWQSRHKALIAIEALLLSSGGSVIRDLCIENGGAFEPLLSAMQTATREKAKQVLTLLGASVDSFSSAHSTPTSPPPPTPPLQRVSREPESSPPPPSSLFAGLFISSAPSVIHATYEPPSASTDNTPSEPPSFQLNDIPLISVEEDKTTIPRNLSLLDFLEASAKLPPSPSPLRDLVGSAPLNESDDSPLLSASPASPASAPPSLQFSATLPSTTSNSTPLIDLGNDTSIPPSPDILAKFRAPSSLTSSDPIPSSPPQVNPSLSTSQPVSPSSSFLTHLMEASPPSSLEELLQSSGVTILAPSAPTPKTAHLSSSPSSSYPFGGPPPKIPMNPNAQLKPAPSTIPHYHQNKLQHPHQNQQAPNLIPLLTSAYPPSHPAPSSIRTTSTTSVYNPLYSVPRAVSNPSSTSSPSPPSSTSSSPSSSSFNFVQQKKADHFGDLVSIQIKHMGAK